MPKSRSRILLEQSTTSLLASHFALSASQCSLSEQLRSAKRRLQISHHFISVESSWTISSSSQSKHAVCLQTARRLHCTYAWLAVSLLPGCRPPPEASGWREINRSQTIMCIFVAFQFMFFLSTESLGSSFAATHIESHC